MIAATQSLINLFYCPTLVDNGIVPAYWKYEFKWQLTRPASVAHPRAWQILLGDHADHLADPLILENLRPFEGFPYESATLWNFSNDIHVGTMIGIDREELEKQKRNLHEQRFKVGERWNNISMEIAYLVRNVESEERIEQLKRDEEVIKNEHDAITSQLRIVERQIQFLEANSGWIPEEIGDTISWHATADNFDPNLTLYWSVLDGNTPMVNEYLTAILDCDKYQDLIWDDANHTLGLTGSAATVDISHVVNDDIDELQDLQYDENTKKLYLSKSNEVIDLSSLHTPLQWLEWSPNTRELSLSNSNENVRLKALTTDLEFDEANSSLKVVGDGKSANLSPLRVVALQGSIENVNHGVGNPQRLLKEMFEDANSELDAPVDRRKRRVRGFQSKIQAPRRLESEHARRLPKGNSVHYRAEGRFTMLFDGRLVGMSITADLAVQDGIVQVYVAECSDVDNVQVYASLETLELWDGSGRSAAIKFSKSIRVNAGDTICFLVSRAWDEDVDRDDNPASLVLLLEQ